MRLVFDQFRAVWALIRGSDEWRSLLRVDGRMALIALSALALSTWLCNIASNAVDETGYALSNDLALSAIACVIPALLAIAWRRSHMARAIALTSAWLGATSWLVSAPFFFLNAFVNRVAPSDGFPFGVLALGLLGVVVICIGFWVSYRVTRALLALSRRQALLFMALEYLLVLGLPIGADLLLGTGFIVNDELRASFAGSS